jgi:hypothetical protein
LHEVEIPPLAEYSRHIVKKVSGTYDTDWLEVVGERSERQVRFASRGTTYSLPFPFELTTLPKTEATTTTDAVFEPDRWRVSLRATPKSYFRLKVGWVLHPPKIIPKIRARLRYSEL